VGVAAVGEGLGLGAVFADVVAAQLHELDEDAGLLLEEQFGFHHAHVEVLVLHVLLLDVPLQFVDEVLVALECDVHLADLFVEFVDRVLQLGDAFDVLAVDVVQE